MALVGNFIFFGDKQIQSQEPDKGEAPEVSIWVLIPIFFNSDVRGPISQVSGSPPVITIVLEYLLALLAMASMGVGGWLFGFQLSFTSHQ
ncbi:MAG: Uncharacterised protein [Flavobacteriaceae bacterium]|nr:MAG: Uncharacterised protein [Flavobacteriaceae bacterium]